MEGGWGSKGVQLVRLRALARDGVRCIVACVVEERAREVECRV